MRSERTSFKQLPRKKLTMPFKRHDLSCELLIKLFLISVANAVNDVTCARDINVTATSQMLPLPVLTDDPNSEA